MEHSGPAAARVDGFDALVEGSFQLLARVDGGAVSVEATAYRGLSAV